MPIYADADDVFQRVRAIMPSGYTGFLEEVEEEGEVLGLYSIPSLNRVNTWLEDAETSIAQSLAAAGLPSSFAGASVGAQQVAIEAVKYAVGQVRNVISAAAGGTESPGDSDINSYEEFMLDLQARPGYWSIALGAAPAEGRSLADGSAIQGQVEDVDMFIPPKFKVGGFL